MTRSTKAVNVLLWILAILLAAVFAVAGAAKLIGVFDQAFAAWGFPPGVPGMIGILELAGGFGLLFKRTAGWSAVGLIAIMLGALWVVLDQQGDTWLIAPAVPIVLMVLLAVVVVGRGLPWATRASDSPGLDQGLDQGLDHPGLLGPKPNHG